MHDTDFINDLNSSNSDQVAESRALDVGIIDGVQLAPPVNTSETANRLLIFTGTAVCELEADGDGELSRGVIRVRLNFPISKTLHVIGSATFAALASVHGNDDEDAVFAVDAATTVVGPTDGGSLPDNGLPPDDLYIIMDAATMGSESRLSRVAYQANVLVRNIEPELESLLVAPADSGQFAPEITLQGTSKWDFKVTLTGPVVDATFLILLQSSDPAHVPVAAATQLTTGQTSGVFFGGVATGDVNTDVVVTITAIARGVSRTAVIRIQRGAR